MLRSAVRLKSLLLVRGSICLASGAAFVPALSSIPELLAMFWWAIPLPFVAAGIIFHMSRHVEDKLTTEYFGLWAVIGLSLMPVSIAMTGWSGAIEHDYLVGSETCPPDTPKDACDTVSSLINETNSELMPLVIPMFGWLIPCLFYAIRGLSNRPL